MVAGANEMAKMGFVGRVKNFLGLFNQTEFEARLIKELRGAVDQDVLVALDDQLSRFNRVQRLLLDDERLACGSTMFYWVKHGKSLINEFPMRIRGLRDSSEHVFFKCFIEDARGSSIRVDFVAVYGVFVLLNFWSPTRTWYPAGDYVIKRTENLIPKPAT
jgi:hypothetical protein